MRIIIGVLLILCAPLSLYSSGSTRVRPTIVKIEPEPKNIASLKEQIYSYSRKNISLHQIKIVGDEFEIRGSSFSQRALRKFIDALKDQKLGRNPNLQTKKNKFAGKITIDFTISAKNIWK